MTRCPICNSEAAPGILHRLDQRAFIVARRRPVSLSSILGSCSCAAFPGANRADPFRLGLIGPGRAW